MIQDFSSDVIYKAWLSGYARVFSMKYMAQVSEGLSQILLECVSAMLDYSTTVATYGS